MTRVLIVFIICFCSFGVVHLLFSKVIVHLCLQLLCQPNLDSTMKSLHLSVYPSSITFIQPSAKFRVKILMSIAGQNFKKSKTWENSIPCLPHWICLLIHQAVSQSLHHHQLRFHQNSTASWGEKCSKLSA